MLQEGKIKLHAVQCCVARKLLCIKNAADTNQEGSEFHTDLDFDYMYDGDGEAQRIIFSNEPIRAI